MTLAELYKSHGSHRENGKLSPVLTQTHWFSVNAHFDPKTGEALPQALSAFLSRIARPEAGKILHDRLWRITQHARPSVERLFRSLNESPRREQAILPVHQVRELDANSFIKLSNRPGRNIREKLAGKPYLPAVRRFQSIDLPENRLLKAFVARLAELLELRQDYLGEEEDELLSGIQSWLLSDAADAIRCWDNLPPNNALLSHRDYRRIWDAWRWLQTLDGDIARDFSHIGGREKTMRLWKEYGRVYLDGTYQFAEVPVFFDYEKFEIRAWVPQLAVRKAPAKIIRSLLTEDIAEPVCVDLAVLRPRYASMAKGAASLRDAFLWQRWKNNDETVDIGLFNSDAAHLHPDVVSISLGDLFFSRDSTLEHCESAGRAFASKLRAVFKNDALIWLVPDFLNDFELEVVRRNLNARFPKAEPLPRSVAAVFERVQYSKIRSDFSVVVVDTIGGKASVTKLIARFDSELKQHLPETNGFYWERCPPVIISREDTESAKGSVCEKYGIASVDDKGNWRDAVAPPKAQFVDPNTLKRDSRIGQFEFCINLTDSPVAGGIRLHALQQRVRDLPLWREQIPELSMWVMKEKNGIRFFKNFYLVSRGTTIKPTRGVPVSIPIDEDFRLPPGHSFYPFPLFRGEQADEIGFSARLDSPAFPLKKEALCQLTLTFEYGADEPYKLIFEPLDKSFPPVHAVWRRTEEIIVPDVPAPTYPTPVSWSELRGEPRRGSQETFDLLRSVCLGIEMLDSKLFVRPGKRTMGRIVKRWGLDKNGARFTYAKCKETHENVFIHEHDLVEGLTFEQFVERDAVSFELRESNGRFSGDRVAKPNYKERTHLRSLDDNATDDLVRSIYRRLYFPFIHVWYDGRSITDKTCPKDFAKAAKDLIVYLDQLANQSAVPQAVKNRVLFLLSCLHKDTTEYCVQWITEQVESGSIRDPRAVGFALGDLSEEWQRYLLNRLAAKPYASAISVFAYAIWREQHFVVKFTIAELRAILTSLSKRLKNIHPVIRINDETKDQWAIRKWVRLTTESLELLLGLLRTRASLNSEIKELLQPHQKITKDFAYQVERITEIVAELDVTLFSRVQLNLHKPANDCTPDLLYALRLYLTGDNGANAIHVTSVSENDND